MSSKTAKLTPYIAVLPAFLIFTLFITVPFLEAFRLSFTDWDGLFFDESYIGFRNYLEMLSNPYFLNSITVTIIYSLGVVVVQNITGLFLALLIDQELMFKKTYKAVLFLPSLLSSVVIGYVFSYMLSSHFGIMRNVFDFFGLNTLAEIDWFGNAGTALFSVILVTCWQFMGYTMVIYFGALQSVPLELYESASIDGAGRLSKFTNITFPLIAQAVTINVILTTIGCLKMFDLIWVLTGGGPAMATQTIGIYIYRSAFHGSRAGYGTAVCIFMFIIIVIISFVQMKLLTAREVEA